METKNSVYIAIKSFCILLMSIAFIYGVYVSSKEVIGFFTLKNKLINEELVLLSENIKSARVELNTKLLDEKIKELDKSILELVKARNENITQVGKIVTRMEASIKELPSFLTVDTFMPSRTMDDTLVFTKDSFGDDFPIARVFYNPYYDGNKWTTYSFPIKFTTSIALGENEDRSDAYVQVYMENDSIQEYKDRKFPIKIESINWVKQPMKDKKFMWNPRISQFCSIGTDIYIGLGISTFSYGRTKRDMDWSFLKLGIGANDDFAFLSFFPAEYNIGDHIPLVENMFIGPTISIDNKLNTGFGMGISIPF